MSIETHLQSKPVCPHCGHVETDAWEWDFGAGLEGDHEGDCNSCGESYLTQRAVTIFYSTFKDTQ